MLWKKNGNATAKANSDLSAYIDEGSEIEGKYTFSGTVMLNGKLSGEITTKDTLIIGEKGVVHASVRAGIVLVNGEVVGNILGTERVELRGSARVVGDVEAPVVVGRAARRLGGDGAVPHPRVGRNPRVWPAQPTGRRAARPPARRVPTLHPLPDP
jgi:cytoskeletal protein CcmA (bactofilin family)